MRTVLITGAGTGIGKATAIKMAQQGYAVVLIGRRAEPLEAVKTALEGEGHQVLPVDVSDKKALHEALHSGALNDYDVQAVFANAGIGGENTYGENDRWDEIMNVNLSGAYYTVMESLPLLEKSSSKHKHILITSSCLARFGVPDYTAYCASKSGVTGLVKALAVQLARENILVNAILPGWVDTEMARAGIQLLANRQGKSYEDAHAEQMSYVPLQKMSDPEEIAALVSFLFSSGQSSITGQCLDINNGSFMI